MAAAVMLVLTAIHQYNTRKKMQRILLRHEKGFATLNRFIFFQMPYIKIREISAPNSYNKIKNVAVSIRFLFSRQNYKIGILASHLM